MSSPVTSSTAFGPAKSVVVVGGTGFIGSHVLQELVRRRRAGQNLQLKSVSRSGQAPSNSEFWKADVEWVSGDVMQPASNAKWPSAMRGASAVISAVGGFGNVEHMRAINGTANVNAMQAAKNAGVPRFVYVSARQHVLPETLKQGYYQGKLAAEAGLTKIFGKQGVAIRPHFVFGTRQFHGFGLPLWIIGKPVQFVTTFIPNAVFQTPYIGPVLAPLLTPWVSVDAVAKAAVDAALEPGQPSKTVIEVEDLLKYDQGYKAN